MCRIVVFFFFSSRRRHTRYWRDWSSDVCSSDLSSRHPTCWPEGKQRSTQRAIANWERPVNSANFVANRRRETMTNRATMIAPSETEAGSAGRQPCRGIAWRVGQNSDRQRGNRSSALPSGLISLIDPNALKIPAPERRNFYLTQKARTPFSAEPEHRNQGARNGPP